MSVIIIDPPGVEIPRSLPDFASFQSWTRSSSFPEKGRIDWVGGEVFVDMSPENLDRHGTVKTAFTRDLSDRIERRDLGVVLVDSSRLASQEADLSAEPDILVILFESVERGRVRLIPAAQGVEEGYVEVEGAADIVVECVSNSSVAKDTRKLPPLYHAAGVREYWLVDARRDPVSFVLQKRGPRSYRESRPDRNGFRTSGVLGTGVRLRRHPARAGLIRYELEFRE